ncbi:hypothetical protein D5W64_12715 [Salmonella enterica subsp. enterica serovar Saintpaul]|nr:hypothetical protein [Salmonella enterica subsp. enterica serovar Saintpaul]
MKEPNRGERVQGMELLSAYKGKMIDFRNATLLVHKSHAFLATMNGLFDLGTDHSAFNYKVKFNAGVEFDTAPVDFDVDQALEGYINVFQYKGEYWIVFNIEHKGKKKKSFRDLTKLPILISYIHAK